MPDRHLPPNLGAVPRPDHQPPRGSTCHPGLTQGSKGEWVRLRREQVQPTASSYEDSVLQQSLFIPVQQTALRLALQLLPQARRALDVGCGTGQLLRCARSCFPTAQLVGVDLAEQMVATAMTVTPTNHAIRYVHARAERLPFSDAGFDLVFVTLSLRHRTDPSAGVAQIGRVLTPGGLLILADVFPSCRRRGPTVPRLRRRHAAVPAELGAVLADHRLAVIGSDHTRWFSLPDVHVIAARQPPA
jgi:SAM-dependent methyltransferase